MAKAKWQITNEYKRREEVNISKKKKKLLHANINLLIFTPFSVSKNHCHCSSYIIFQPELHQMITVVWRTPSELIFDVVSVLRQRYGKSWTSLKVMRWKFTHWANIWPGECVRPCLVLRVRCWERFSSAAYHNCLPLGVKYSEGQHFEISTLVWKHSV